MGLYFLDRMKKTFLFILLSLLFVGCMRTSNEYLWDTQNMPVVYSLITPGANIKVALLQTYPNGLNSMAYADADIFVNDNAGDTVELTRIDSVLFEDTLGAMAVDSGKTYYLTVCLNDGSDTVRAQTTVPNAAAQFSFFSYTLMPDVNEDTTYYYPNISVKWYAPSENQKTDNYWSYESWWTNLDIVTLDSLYMATGKYGTLPDDTAIVYIGLLTMDEWAYRFVYNQRQQEYMTSAYGDFDSYLFDEFSGVVLPDFSNIENGYGCFGSYLIRKYNLHGEEIQ